jgi:hypothetical protein
VLITKNQVVEDFSVFNLVLAFDLDCYIFKASKGNSNLTGAELKMKSSTFDEIAFVSFRCTAGFW